MQRAMGSILPIALRMFLLQADSVRSSGNRYARRIRRNTLHSRRVNARNIVLVGRAALARVVLIRRLCVDRRVEQLVRRAAGRCPINPVPAHSIGRTTRSAPCQVNLVRLSRPRQRHGGAPVTKSSTHNLQLPTRSACSRGAELHVESRSLTRIQRQRKASSRDSKASPGSRRRRHDCCTGSGRRQRDGLRCVRIDHHVAERDARGVDAEHSRCCRR